MPSTVWLHVSVKVKQEGAPIVLIGELAESTGASARALRHYEEQGLLTPERSSNGYREYSEADITRVAQIKTMISAGMGTLAIRRYLDCARSGDQGTALQMCPQLRADLDALATRLRMKQRELQATEQRLTILTSAS